MLREADVFEAQGFSFADPGEQKAAPTLVAVESGVSGASATIPDAHLLFNSDFVRSGNDLHLNGHDGERAVVRDYFASGERVALLSREGARLSPDIVDALTGAVAPGQYAQAAQTPSAGNDAVGRVVTVSADSTILRNGVPVAVRPGDAVLRADVLQTTGGTMAVTFNDGSTLNLTANTRIVVSEFVYSPNGAGNSQLLDLVQGSLTFISGEVAHSGNMSIGTPVATMGIRGTVGGVTTASDGTVQFYVSQSATGAVIINAQGQIIANVVQDGPLIIVRPVGPLQVVAEEIGKSPQQLAIELQALQQIVSIKAIGDQLIQQFFQPQQQQNPNPQSPNGPHTQIQADDKFKITLISNDDAGAGSVTPPTHAVIETRTVDPNLPPTIINVPIPVNLPPVVFAPLKVTGLEDTPLTFGGARAISIFDNDSQTLTVTLSVTAGVLSFAGTAGLAFSAGDGASDTTMTFSGSPAAINAAMNGLTFTPPQDYSGSAVLSITKTDGNSAPTTTTVGITVEAVNDVPVLNYFNLTIDGDGPVVLAPSDYMVTDPDGPSVIFTVTNVTGGSFSVDTGLSMMFFSQLNNGGAVTFTSDDIAAGRVSFVPDGSGDPVSYSISVSDGIASSTPVVDHQPHAVDIEAEVTAGSAASSYNIVIILDVSGSMAGQRLIDAKAAIANLLGNDSINSVMAVSFSGNGDVYSGEGGPWVSAGDANEYFQMLGTGGGTNYVDAIADVMTAWNANQPGAADKTLVYFISDGEPSQGLNGTQTAAWESFLLGKGVDASYAIGISPNISGTNLEPIAWKPGDAGFDPINLQSTADLANTLQGTVISTQNIYTDGDASLGGDGGRILSIVVDGETYTWNGLNSVTSSSQQTWSSTAASLTVTTALGGILTFYFGDEDQAHAGDWSYSPPETLSAASNEVFHYTLVDNDGDKSSADITVSVLSSNDAPVLTGSLTATVNEGEMVALTPQQLGFIDQDDNAADITFTVSNVVNGDIYVGEGHSLTFTGAQLAAGEVFFAHDGSESSVASFDVCVEDGDEDNSTPEVRTFNITVDPVNDAPIVDLNGEVEGGDYTIVGNNDGSPISVFGPDLVISDVDTATLQSASITVRLANQGEYYTTYGADNLNVDASVLEGAVSGQGASGDWQGLHWQATSGSNGLFLSVTGAASLAVYEELLAAVRFSTDSSDLDNRIFTLTVNDGDADSEPVTSTINIAAAGNDAPSIDLDTTQPGTGYSTSIAADGTPVAVFGDVAVGDADGNALHGATVQLVGGGEYTDYANDHLYLNLSALSGTPDSESNGYNGSMGGLTWSSMNGGGGLILTISGIASFADYQQLLAAVRFDTTSGDTTDRTVTVTVNDGTVDSAPAISIIHVQGGGEGGGGGNGHTPALGDAVNLDGQFFLQFDSEVDNSGTTPHVSVFATGTGTFDIYSFTVTSAGSTGIFDIDHAGWDSYIYLYDSWGTLIGYNDDSDIDPGSETYDSRLSYYFDTAGTYYIEVGSYPDSSPIQSGNSYALHVTLENAIEQIDFISASSHIDTSSGAIAPAPSAHESLPIAPLGDPAHVTYGFRAANDNDPGFSPFSAAQQAAAIAALALWAESAGIHIAAAAEGQTGTIQFGNSTNVDYAVFTANVGADGGTVWINPDFAEATQTAPGGYGFLTLLHEIGHALGLGHPADDATQLNTVMAYQAPDVIGIDWWSAGGEWIDPQTPMVSDIAALQSVYGANSATRDGDTVYGFNSTAGNDLFDFTKNANPVLTITDAGGNDTLDLSGYDTPSTIDLNDGAMSSANGMTYNIGIALGTAIETAVGGGGNDRIIGSARAETLIGGGGADLLSGGGGADQFVFKVGSGADTIMDFSGHAGQGDHIVLDNFSFANFAELLQGASITDIGLDGDHTAFIDLGGGDTITLEHVNPDFLVAADFIFRTHDTLVG